MSVTIEYFAQARVAAGCDTDEVDVADGQPLGEIARILVERRGDALRKLLVDDAGAIHPWIITSINGAAATNADVGVKDGDVVRFISPISGG